MNLKFWQVGAETYLSCRDPRHVRKVSSLLVNLPPTHLEWFASFSLLTGVGLQTNLAVLFSGAGLTLDLHHQLSRVSRSPTVPRGTSQPPQSGEPMPYRSSLSLYVPPAGLFSADP